MARAESYEDYLTSLGMEMQVASFDAVGRARIAQLINRSNQFNLTTKRYNDEDVARIETSPTHLGLQIRLKDRFADNGMISVIVIDKAGTVWLIDTWLMSCRVLKRGVENAVLNILVEMALKHGAAGLIGTYTPTAKNGMVAEHYQSLGFLPSGDIPGGPQTDDGRRATGWRLDLAGYVPKPVQMKIEVEMPE
jgi:FkbH-like protein